MISGLTWFVFVLVLDIVLEVPSRPVECCRGWAFSQLFAAQQWHTHDELTLMLA